MNPIIKISLIDLKKFYQSKIEAIDILLCDYVVEEKHETIKPHNDLQNDSQNQNDDYAKIPFNEVFEKRTEEPLIESFVTSKKVIVKKSSEKEIQKPARLIKNDELKAKRDNVVKILKDQDRIMTSKEVEKLYCDEYGTTYANENFARNTVIKLTTEGIIMRAQVLTPYHYGLKSWFKPSGALLDDYKKQI